MSNEQQILVPDIGGATDVDVIEVSVKVGDTIAVDDAIITLESDKASMDVPSPFAGTVKAIQVNVGDKVSEGSQILTLAVEGEGAKSEKTSADVETELSVAIPDLGGASDVDVIEVNIKPGDKVAIDDALIVLESDKASMDVPSPYAGEILTVRLKVGDKVSEGQEILVLKGKAEKNAPAPKAPAASTSAPLQMPNKLSLGQRSLPSVGANASADIYASPAVRRISSEFGIDLENISGTARKGRVAKQDVQNFVKGALQGSQGSGSGLSVSPAPKIDFSKFGETEIQPLNKIKKATGVNLHRNWVTVPHVTQFGDADITKMDEFRKAKKSEAEKKGFKLTPIAFIMKAVVLALKEFPKFNASLDEKGENLILKKYFNLGVAVDTPSGLVVPVIQHVDQKSIFDLAKELGAISEQARTTGLSLKDMQGACFTISSLGGIGGTAFTPIVNVPEVSILGLSKASIKPIYEKDTFVPCLMMPLSLSYDHRVIDGADGARFITYLAQCLGDLELLLQ